MASGPAHPAKKLVLIALLCMLLSVLLGFIAVFVPWSQRDIGTSTAWFYPFKWCIEDKTSSLHYTQCEDEDFGGHTVGQIVTFSVPTAGDLKCRGYFIATVVFVFIHVIIGVLALVGLAALMGMLWKKSAKMCAICTALLVFISFAGSVCSWAMFIVYAEHTCTTGTVFPLQGYSYGWICEIFATLMGLIATCAICAAIAKIGKAPKVQAPKEPEYEPYEYQPYWAAYPQPIPYTMNTPMNYPAPYVY